MKNTRIAAILTIALGLAGFAAASPALAESNGTSTPQGRIMQGRMMPPPGKASSTRALIGQEKPAVVGTVTAISGSTITISSKTPGRSEKGAMRGATSTPVSVTYTVNASAATVIKNGATSTVSSIASGDVLAVVGTVSGTNIAAKLIIDGEPRPMPGKGPKEPAFTGNGQPVVLGTVSSISGSTLVITNKSNVQYTVDASNAVIRKGAATSTVSAIVVGDNVVVQGTVNGTSIAASTILDQKPVKPLNANGNNGNNNQGKGGGRGFFGAVGGFFAHLFGF